MSRVDARYLVRRRAKDAGIETGMAIIPFAPLASPTIWSAAGDINIAKRMAEPATSRRPSFTTRAAIRPVSARLKEWGFEDANPRVHLRILTIRGTLETEYDAALAKATWAEVELEAKYLGEYRLAARASGEQGILAFLLSNIGEATDRVKRAYFSAILWLDRPAEVRYASLVGRGIVELGRYKESLT